jgi:hypothetical protein
VRAGDRLFAFDCEFIATAVTSGTMTWLARSVASFMGACVGNTFTTHGGAAVITCMSLGLSSTITAFGEVANTIPSTLFAYSATPGISGLLELGTRELRQAAISQAAGGTVSPSTLAYGFLKVTVTDAVAFTIDPELAPIGARLIIVFRNEAGLTTGTITWGANVQGMAAFTIVSANSRTYMLVSMNEGGAVKWVPVSEDAAGSTDWAH